MDETRLSTIGLALTLTVRNTPPDGATWQKLRRAFLRRLERLGMVRCHWITEWQRRGAPHLHMAVWFPPGAPGTDPTSVIGHWLYVSRDWGSGDRGQHAKPIADSVGWFKYLSKHAVRGLGHYQRSSENIPPGWIKTGRMWGHTGIWPLVEPIRYELSTPGFHAFRRIVQRWRLADARASGDRHRIRAARRMLQANDQASASVRGVSEWLPQDETAAILHWLARQGFEVQC